MRLSSLLGAVVASIALTSSAVAQSTKCVACGLIFTLLEQPSDGSLPTGGNPDSTCTLFGFCNGTCLLFPGAAGNGASWPVGSPVIPTDGGVIDQRRRFLRKAMPRPKGKVGHHKQSEEAPLKMPTVEQAVSFLNSFDETKKRDFFGIWSAVASFFHSVQQPQQQEPAGLGRSLQFVPAPACPSPASNISCDIHRAFELHVPVFDADNDYHAPASATPENPRGDLFVTGLRGTDWRGADCNDNDATVYPGRSNRGSNGPSVDHNCNGIVGGNASVPDFEEAFCSGANAPMGVAILGDSAAAHFHLPPEVFNKRSFNISGILELASNEVDWPQCSWSTGYRTTEECPNSFGVPMGSVYQRVRESNLCNHRDFQNAGVNGARTGSMAPPGIVNSLQRSQADDAPLLVFFALIGNDVCNGHPGLGSMTTPQQFQANVLNSLKYLDTSLPKGSHVAFLGLADGRILFDTTQNRTHPLGIPYPSFYTYLSCNGANPCWGWLNDDASWRNATSQRAAELTATYDAIIAQNSSSFTSFDMYRLNVDWFALINNYTRTGQDAMNIIEPVDGFHPSQTGQQLLAEVIWEDLATNRPEWLPTVNPYNAEIVALFGDQGGY